MKVLDIKINVALAALACLAQSSCAKVFKTSEMRHLPFGHIRSLQEIWDCTTPPERENFFEAALGPFFDSRGDLSVFLELTDDPYGDYITIPLTRLAEALIYSSFHFIQEEETFGHNGEFTAELLAQHQLLREFWKLDKEVPQPVLLGGIHSEDLSDIKSMIKAIRSHVALEGLDEMGQITNKKYRLAAAEAQQLILDLPGNYSNPLLTFTAIFYPDGEVEGFPNSPLIVLGDGIMDFSASLGHTEVSNDILHAHEFGHLLQYITGLEDAGGDVQQFLDDFIYNVTPEKSREIELAADAYASYFLAHEQGRNFEIPQLLLVARDNFFFGDCQFSSTGHHGTPEQRECASLWGAQLALSSTSGKDPISLRQFKVLFEENVQSILDDDYSVCVMDELIDTNPTASFVPSSAGTKPPTPVSAAPSPTMSATPAPSPGSSTSELPSSPLPATASPTLSLSTTPTPTMSGSSTYFAGLVGTFAAVGVAMSMII